MSVQDSFSGEGRQEYLSKKVSINGQTVTLYSSNGQTWFSSPEEIPEVMARLDNTRILLNEPKGEAPAAAPKPTSAKYRIRGPKPRPILQQEGGPITGTPVEPVSSSTLEVKVGQESLEIVSKPAKGAGHASASTRKVEPAKQYQKLVAPVSTGPKPLKVPKAPAVKAAAAPAKSKEPAGKKVSQAKETQAKETQAKDTQESKPRKASSGMKKSALKKASVAKSAPKKIGAKKAPIKKIGGVKKKRS
jgi:hypothetical protein